MWQSNRLVSDGLQVQLLSPAPEMRLWCNGSIRVFQTHGTSSSLVDRFLSPVTQWVECLSYKEEVAGSNPARATNFNL